jgi:hypothetical protein
MANLIWEYYNTPKISNTHRKIVAQHKFELPDFIHEKRECTIDICEVDYSWTGLIYEATIWWFNRGVTIVSSGDRIKTIEDAIEIVNTRIVEISNCFYKK